MSVKNSTETTSMPFTYLVSYYLPSPLFRPNLEAFCLYS